MNNIKSIVKVMNFHSLLRVDKSKDRAKKYKEMESTLIDMIEMIMYNRNIMIDFKRLKPDPKLPELDIYIGSDMGFCSNINSQVKKFMDQEPEGAKEIIIGRKLLSAQKDIPLLYMTRENFNKDEAKVAELVEQAIRSREYSAVNIIYNRFINASKVAITKRTIWPIEPREDHQIYTEDYSIEGDAEELLQNMIVLMAKYSVYSASASSSAAENINRQNVTTQSLEKIDEREEIALQEHRREQRDKQFAKVLDNYTHRR